jgi:two-component system sensor histidine kinase PilS (NtrC family)
LISAAATGLRRRVTYLMLFRLVLISLVLGATIFLSTLGDYDIASPYSLILFAIIGTTYLLTVIYAVALQRGFDPARLGDVQMVADLATTALLVHVTGGASSAYTFFFPLAIIGAATIRYRKGAVAVAAASVALFVAVSLLGWKGILPTPAGQRILPTDLGSLEVIRAMALNGAAIASVAVLAYTLGAQIQRTAESLEFEREAAADLYALHEDIVRSLSSGLITIGTRGNVLAVNQAAVDMLDRPPTELIGRPVDAVLPGIDALLAGVDARDLLRRGDLTIGERAFGISVSPLRDNGDRLIGRVVNFQDLTELRQMEGQVKRAERLAAIGKLAAGIAHEIRNPLASISGSIELLRAAPADDAAALMAIITREIERLNRMISDLLDYANPQPRERVPFDLAALVDETLRVFVQDKSFDGVEVVLDPGSPTEGLLLEGDPAKLRQVLWNLLRNAAEAATAGGKHVTVKVGRGDDMAVVEILDDGAGMEPSVVEHVFEPFFTTKRRGTGLGLATSHNIVAEHGGRIQVVSEPGAGSSFTVLLPVAGKAAYTGPA